MKEASLSLHFGSEAGEPFARLLQYIEGYVVGVEPEDGSARFDAIFGIPVAGDWLDEVEVQPVDDRGEPVGATRVLRVKSLYIY